MIPIKSYAKIRRIQKKIAKARGIKTGFNSYKPFSASKQIKTKGGGLLITEINYAQEYPNSYCDIWYSDSVNSQKNPTLFYFHGGGFFFGNKTDGDPMAVKGGDYDDLFCRILDAGFNIISVDYALAPKFHFPVPIIQMNQCFEFFKINASKYSINIEQVVLFGGSAGADMVEIYGALAKNPQYAKTLKITPILKNEIKAIVVDEAALSPEVYDDRMKIMTEAFLGTTRIKTGKSTLFNAANYITEGYPPVFINSSNSEPWFLLSAQDLEKAVKAVGGEYEFCYFSKEKGELNHGYLNLFATNNCAKECLERMLAFITKKVKRKG